jgi:uncharacterized membrane protein
MLRILTGFLFFLWALAAAGTTLYTGPAFQILDLDPVALHIVNGTISFADLPRFERSGLVFTEAEIQHFTDIRSAVSVMHGCLLALLAILICLIVWRPQLSLSGTSTALIILISIAIALTAMYVFVGYEATSDLLHQIYFDAGSYVFPGETLTARLYGQTDMLKGAAFVAAVTAFLLVLAWAIARLALPARWRNADRSVDGSSKAKRLGQ